MAEFDQTALVFRHLLWTMFSAQEPDLDVDVFDVRFDEVPVDCSNSPSTMNITLRENSF